MIKITYLEHSGFAVECDDYVLIFDYYKGNLPQFDKDKKICVFASHVHYDHFKKKIFTWFQCHDTTRDGWFFTNGRGIHVNWEKTSDYGATRYYDDNGDEIVLNAGKTMICIVEDGDSFTFH